MRLIGRQNDAALKTNFRGVKNKTSLIFSYSREQFLILIAEFCFKRN